MANWDVAQEWEAEWWGNCANTFGEEEKQLFYAERMGLKLHHDGKSPYCLDLDGRSVVDIGGGPCSLLLKGINPGRFITVVEPCRFPGWVYNRYDEVGIGMIHLSGEVWVDHPGLTTEYDEAWLYNVLQHVEDPEKVCANALRAATLVRVFEWIDMAPTDTHISLLTRDKLEDWLRGVGKVEDLNLPTLKGRAFYGIFLGRAQ